MSPDQYRICCNPKTLNNAERYVLQTKFTFAYAYAYIGKQHIISYNNTHNYNVKFHLSYTQKIVTNLSLAEKCICFSQSIYITVFYNEIPNTFNFFIIETWGSSNTTSTWYTFSYTFVLPKEICQFSFIYAYIYLS